MLAMHPDYRMSARVAKDLFDWARQHAVPLVTCEYNIVPANESSRLFHEKSGFRNQGTQWLANRSKQVLLQTAAT